MSNHPRVVSETPLKRRFFLDTPRDRALAAREAELIDGSERRDALPWRAYWIASEMGEYGDAPNDVELRLVVAPELAHPR